MKLKKGKYTIVRQLGQGGFGITYLATTPVEVKGKVGGRSKAMTVEAPVVVKEFFLKEYCTRGEDNTSVNVLSAGVAEMVTKYREKFKKEAQKLSQMDHPNIVEVTDVIEDENNTSYYVMRFLSGGTLYNLVRPNEKDINPLPEELAIRYIKQIGSALGYMHRQGMCHFDVKPNNIMLDENDNAVLIDFGLAKNYSKDGQQTSSLLVGASVGYAPLEQANANLETFSPQTDVYALGATLYFLLTGNKPKAAAFNLSEVLPKGQCNISDNVWNAIQRSMQANPKDRPSTVEAFLQLLDSDNETVILIPETEKTVTPKKSFVERIHKLFANNRTSILWSAILVLGTVGAILIVNGLSQNDNTMATPNSIITDTINNAERMSVVEEKVDTVENMEIRDEQGNLLFIYTGPMLNKLPEGFGKAVYSASDPQQRAEYEGDFIQGQRDGDGMLIWKNRTVFIGTFVADHLNNGKYQLTEGSYFDGEFQNDKPFEGTWYNADGTKHGIVRKGKFIKI